MQLGIIRVPISDHQLVAENWSCHQCIVPQINAVPIVPVEKVTILAVLSLSLMPENAPTVETRSVAEFTCLPDDFIN